MHLITKLSDIHPVKQIAKTALLINTGSSRNLGDRAMLFNVQRLLSEGGVQKIYSSYPVRPASMDPRVKLVKYCSLSSHLGRLSSLGVKPGNFIVTIELFCVFAGLSLLCLPARLGLERTSRWLDRNDLLCALRNTDFILYSGGGYLTDLGALEARACLLTGILGILLGKPVYFSGQGIGPLSNPVTRILLKFVAHRAGIILVRDQNASKETLTRLNIDYQKIREAGDDALTPMSFSGGTIQKTDRNKILGMHLRLTPFGNRSAEIIEQSKSIFQPLIDKGWRLRFFIFATQSTWEHDLYSRLTSNMNESSFSIVQSDDPGEIRRSIGECTVCVGMAYHFLLFALAEAIPAIGLYSGPYYRQKLNGLYGWYNRREWLLDQEVCNSENLIDLIQSMCFSRELLSQELAETTHELSSHYMHDMDALIKMAMEGENDNK